MIINVHGFGGNGCNTKFMWLRENFPHEKIYSPTFDYLQSAPSVILEQLETAARDAFERGESVQAVGTSWGGFFAYCLHAIFARDKNYKLPVVLCNPALNPHLITINLDLQVHTSLFIPYLEPYQLYMFRHDPECCSVIIGTLDKVIPHEFVTVPIFRDTPECLHWFPFGHDFDIQSESGVQSIITSVVG